MKLNKQDTLKWRLKVKIFAKSQYSKKSVKSVCTAKKSIFAVWKAKRNEQDTIKFRSKVIFSSKRHLSEKYTTGVFVRKRKNIYGI